MKGNTTAKFWKSQIEEIDFWVLRVDKDLEDLNIGQAKQNVARCRKDLEVLLWKFNKRNEHD